MANNSWEPLHFDSTKRKKVQSFERSDVNMWTSNQDNTMWYEKKAYLNEN